MNPPEPAARVFAGDEDAHIGDEDAHTRRILRGHLLLLLDLLDERIGQEPTDTTEDDE